MPRTYTHDMSVEIGLPDSTVLIDAELTYSYTPGRPAHYGSMSYPGHPADPDEIEIERIVLTRTDHKTKVCTTLDCPKWLFDVIVAGADTDLMAREAGEDLLEDDFRARRHA